MYEYELVSIDDDGNGYAKFYLDGVKVYGQHFRGAPIGDPLAFDEWMFEQHEARMEQQSKPAIHQEILDKKIKKTEVKMSKYKAEKFTPTVT